MTAQIFQRFMDEVCHGLDFMYIYLDDLLVVSMTPEEHQSYLQLLFQHLAMFELVINPESVSLVCLNFTSWDIISIHLLYNLFPFVSKQSENFQPHPTPRVYIWE